jgi:2-oxoisovalerate dehydrogenase E1 component
LLSESIATEAQLKELEAAIRKEVDAASAHANACLVPPAEEFYTDVFADPALIPDNAIATAQPRAAATYRAQSDRKMTFGQAVNEALAIALESDPSVFLLGEDIADPAGGVVKTTYGLSTKFGRHRVRPTPIAEQAIVGAAIGAAMAGMKPVAEIMINDFLMVCMDQRTFDHPHTHGWFRRQLRRPAFAIARGLARPYAGLEDRLSQHACRG